MQGKKWAIVTNTNVPAGVHETLALDSLDSQPEDVKEKLKKIQTRLFYIDDRVQPGSFYSELVWINEVIPEDKAHFGHTHEFDELIYFIGSDPKNPTDLGGEVEVWIDGEKNIITKTCVVFVPAGVKHAPIIFHRIDRPILHGAVANGARFESDPPT